MFSLRAEGFSCSLDIGKLQFFIQKGNKKNFNCIFFFFSFWSSKPLDPDPYPGPNSLEMLDPEPYPDSMNSDPQLC
jgi:hypothetical protein